MISDAVGPTLDDTDFVVKPLHEAEGDLVVGMAVADDAVPVPCDHFSEVLEGLKSAPAQVCFPVVEEFPSPGRVLVVPQLAKGLLEQVRLIEPAIGLEQEAQGTASLQVEVGPVRQQGIALAFDEPAVVPADAVILQATDLVHGLGQMSQDVELVVDDEGVGRVARRRGPEGLPHVHHRQADGLACLRSEVLVESVHLLLAPPFTTHPDRPTTIQIADQDGITVALPDRDLVDANGSRPPRGRMLGEQVPHVVQLDAPHLIPTEAVHLGHSAKTHLPTLAADDLLEPAGISFRGRQPGKGLLFHAATDPASDSPVFELQVDAGSSTVQVSHPVDAVIVKTPPTLPANRTGRFF